MRTRLLHGVLSLVLLIGLGGCVKIRVGALIQADDQVKLEMAVGMTQSVRELFMASEGAEDPFESITEEIFSDMPGIQDVQVRDWSEGEYSWRAVSGLMPSMDYLNAEHLGEDMVRSFKFSHTQEGGRDRYEFDATVDPALIWKELESEAGSEGDEEIPFELKDVLDLEFLVGLPGRIVDTNGTRVEGDPNALLWTIQGTRLQRLYAVSEVVRGESLNREALEQAVQATLTALARPIATATPGEEFERAVEATLTALAPASRETSTARPTRPAATPIPPPPTWTQQIAATETAAHPTATTSSITPTASRATATPNRTTPVRIRS